MFAPPEFGPGLAPLRGVLPPALQDQHMRASRLYNFMDLDVGSPKTKEKTIEATIELPPPILQPSVEANPPGNFAGPLPPHITVPSGWKPGMPVELPKDLPVPLPPPGWKPDPLPPLDSIPMPRILEQQSTQPVAAPRGLQKPSEPIRVRHVQLDILDQDDDSSDHGSDEESSDDDDDE